jgi:MoaA/NifB/PqqE/SkfB family radical SAM enzyme
MIDKTNQIKLITRSGIRAFFPGHPPYIIFFVTHRCNAKCPFCFDRENREKTDSTKELTIDQIKNIANNWRSPIHVTLTGGEPFLRKDILDIALAWVEAGAASITIATNATMTDRVFETVSSLLESCPDTHLDLNISICGPQALHDKIMGIPGAYEKAFDTAGGLFKLQEKHRGFRLGATVVVSGSNSEESVKTIEDIVDSGLFKRVQPLWVRGNPFDKSALECDFSVYEEAKDIVSGKLLSDGTGRIKEVLSKMVREDVCAIVKGKTPPHPCQAGRTMVTIDPFGNVFPCEILDQKLPSGSPDKKISSWSMGALSDNDYMIENVLKSEQAKTISSWVKESRCSCSFECAAYNNIVFNYLRWPGVISELLK